MKLFLMRHGEAEISASSDSQRRLTDSGAENVREIALRDHSDLSAIETIWVSPYVRAQQTAEIITDTFDQKIHCETHNFLKPSSDPNAVFNALQEQSKPLLLITHQPLIGTMVDLLAGLEPGSHRLGTAALACIESDIMARACGELRWLHQPTYQ